MQRKLSIYRMSFDSRVFLLTERAFLM
ncbi:hypothetical protein D049_3909A, partial [Vibrio parahaemolyticus VPTS-2010]